MSARCQAAIALLRIVFSCDGWLRCAILISRIRIIHLQEFFFISWAGSRVKDDCYMGRTHRSLQDKLESISWLGANKFEHLQVLKHAWRSNIKDRATTNSVAVESIDIDPELQLEQFKELLIHENEVEHELHASELVTTYY
ncbi:hypothetical protein SCLCIDRAFT_30833 [Scleroderma citrinum Foug A]|uniref:Uncharacterized protein n=1 Tax=Scleroderma citrinum Foug A TaxID=1036808 RepID=A0A0C3D1T0_9AGAM|nr:hypothetical protein SCLCIDRAFT_30833 [Scleroderma citrinum Foug A]